MVFPPVLSGVRTEVHVVLRRYDDPGSAESWDVLLVAGTPTY